MYLILNLISYGLFIAGFVAALIFPEVIAGRSAAIEGDGTAGLVRSVLSTPNLFALLILGVNIITIGALSIVLPSLIVPFAGIAYQAFTLGSVLTPTSELGAL